MRSAKLQWDVDLLLRGVDGFVLQIGGTGQLTCMHAILVVGPYIYMSLEYPSW